MASEVLRATPIFCTHLSRSSVCAYRPGRALKFYAGSETIAGDAEASCMLGREYRKGFEVPEKV